jgi:hypothetical protein
MTTEDLRNIFSIWTQSKHTASEQRYVNPRLYGQRRSLPTRSTTDGNFLQALDTIQLRDLLPQFLDKSPNLNRNNSD